MSEIIVNGMVFDGEVDDDGGFVYCTMNFETNLLIESVKSGECLTASYNGKTYSVMFYGIFGQEYVDGKMTAKIGMKTKGRIGLSYG